MGQNLLLATLAEQDGQTPGEVAARLHVTTPTIVKMLNRMVAAGPLERVTDDLAEHGLVGFSLRRGARAAGTTHKVLLYHFDDVDDLLHQAVLRLRERRIMRAQELRDRPGGVSLAVWVRGVWEILIGEESRVLYQAIGLMLYDPERYVGLGRGASRSNTFRRSWPPARPTGPTSGGSGWPRWWMAALRGFLVDRVASGDDSGARAGLVALTRALDRKEAVDG